MAFYNKMATLLRQTVSAKNAQISGGSMFNTIRCVSYAKLFDAKSKGLKSSKIFNAKAKGLTRLNRFNAGSKGITSAKARAKGITGHGLLQLLEMRLDNTLVRMGMASTVATARQLVSHGHVLVNGVGSKPSYHCKPGDIITAKDGEKFTALMQNSPAIGKLRSSIREQNLGTAKYVIGKLRTSIEQEDIETAKRLGTTKVCEGSSFAEHTRIKRSLYRFKSLFSSKRRNEKNQYVPPRTVSSIVNNFVFHRSKYCSIVSPALKPRRRKIKRISLPTHHLEVNYKTREAVVCYAPNVNHIPHGLSAKRLNVLL